MRCSDLVSRYGGEEFAVILPSTPLEDALLAAERARSAIERKRFRFEGRDLSLTASFGVARLRSIENTTLLIRRTDEALYASKQAGRNNTHWHDGRSAQAANVNDASDKLESANGNRDPQSSQAELDIPAGKPASCAANNADNTPRSRAGETQLGTGDVLPSHVPGTHVSRHDEDSLPQYHELRATLGSLANRTEFCRAVQCRLGEWKRGGECFSAILLSILDRRSSNFAHLDVHEEFVPRVPHAALTAVEWNGRLPAAAGHPPRNRQKRGWQNPVIQIAFPPRKTEGFRTF